jgi:hypothetical protein
MTVSPRRWTMETSPPPLSLADALALPVPNGRRSAEVLVDGDLELRFYAPDSRHSPTTSPCGSSSTGRESRDDDGNRCFLPLDAFDHERFR